jgi:hypothetical protein
MKLLANHLCRCFRCELALFDLPLQSKHLKKGCIQTVLGMHLKKGGIVEIECLILGLKLLLVLLLVSLETSPLLLGRIHVANKSLNLRRAQILAVDTANSSRNLSRSQFTSRHFRLLGSMALTGS